MYWSFKCYSVPAWIAVGQWADGEVARAQQQDDEKNELESDDPFDLGLKSEKEVSWGMQQWMWEEYLSQLNGLIYYP